MIFYSSYRQHKIYNKKLRIALYIAYYYQVHNKISRVYILYISKFRVVGSSKFSTVYFNWELSYVLDSKCGWGLHIHPATVFLN